MERGKPSTLCPQVLLTNIQSPSAPASPFTGSAVLKKAQALDAMAHAFEEHLVEPYAFHAGSCQQAAREAIKVAKKSKGPDLEAAGVGVAMEWRHMTAIRRVTLTSSLLEAVDISSNESTDVKEGWQVGRGLS
jgi:hypothetical protein|mmetsp:Transcript_9230/g.23099  ORF Transcript_9230/g.23099 Transcript_9230/m.23099 type:complete len:133 (-) Transcript_9230:286-684(-)